jgi:NitT/TauT family transport system substrate-binding protein
MRATVSFTAIIPIFQPPTRPSQQGNAAMRSFIRLTVLSLSALFGGSVIAHAAEMPVKAGVSPIIDQAQYYAAHAQGFFKSEGLSVDTMAANPPALIPALTAGAIQVVPTAGIVTVLQAIEQGVPLLIVGPGTQVTAPPPDISPIVVRADGPIKAPKDLEGRTLAVPALAGNLWLYARVFLAKNGVDLAKVRFLEVPFPQQFDVLLSGRIDAAAMTEPFATNAIESGKAKAFAYPYSQTQPVFVSVVMVTTPDWAKGNADTLRRFAHAYLRGQAWINERKKTREGADLIASYTKLDPAVVAKINVPDFPQTIDVKAIETTAQLMLEHGVLKKIPDLKAVIAPPVP